MASFKVPCPSCEHQVPIKSESEIGTKVECPKCKYRFKVEAPAGGVPKDAAKADKKKPAEKPAGKKKSKKTVAIVVGVVAVAILAVVGFAMMGGGKKPPNTGGPKGPVAGGPSTGTPGPGTGGDPGEGTEPKPEDKDNKEKDKKDRPKKVIPFSGKEASNLLPGQTVALARLDVDRLRQTPARVFFDNAMREMFQSSIGVSDEQVAAYYHAYVGKARDPFGVIQLNTPVTERDVVARMTPAGAPKPVRKQWNLYRFKSNPFVSGVSNAMAFGSLFGELYEKVPTRANEKPTSTPEAPRAVGLCVYDSQHILVGDYAQLEAFLSGLSDKGDPKFFSGTKEAPGVTLTDTPYYLSIDPKLKRAMREVGGESDSPPLVVYAEKYDAGAYDPKLLKSDYQAIAVVLDPILSRAEFLSGNLNDFSNQGLSATVRVVMKSDAAAFEVVKEQLTPGLTTAAQFLSLYLHTPVTVNNQTSFGSGSPTPGTGVPGTSGMPPDDSATGGGGQPPVPGSGMGPPPGFGSAAGPPQRPNYGGSMSPQPGKPSGFPMPPNTGFPPDMGIPGTGTPAPTPDQVRPSQLGLKLSDQNITVTVELNWSDELFRDKIEPQLMGVANTLKGKVAVFASDVSFRALSSAVVKMTEATKKFPRGTAERALTDVSRFGIKHDPKTRLSFFAELLPYVSTRGDELRKQLGTDQAWFDDGKNQKPEGMNNLLVAEAWIPELLVPTYPQSAWRATSPMVAAGRVLGGTNYVGVAGVGLDAARYDPKNPNQAKKVGIAGYEWGSEVSEVTDGLENTIYLLQTPPGLPQPWIAGGGATVRGLDEKDPMQGFRHTYGTPDGKPGTFALMGNGDVRFIPGDIDPKLLLAMATRAGGENIAARLEKEAPLVLSAKQKDEPKAEPKGDETPAGPPEPAPAPRSKG